MKKAIDALNATAGTANDKLDAIKDAIDSPMSGLNVKLDAIKEAVAKGLASVTEKQDLILAALNSESSHNFTEDELIEVGNDHLYVDAYFWKNHAQDDYEINKVLKKCSRSVSRAPLNLSIERMALTILFPGTRREVLSEGYIIKILIRV